MNNIIMRQQFEVPVSQVFDALSKHATFDMVLWAMQSVRTRDAEAPLPPDGVGFIRNMGLGPIKPIKEQITRMAKDR